MKEIDEKKLAILFNKYINDNSEQNLEAIYLQYSKLVEKIAFSILKNYEDSEDIVQTVFTKIFKMPKEKLPSINFTSWLYKVTKNEAISLLRTKKEEIDLEKIYEIQDKNNEIESIIEKDEFNRLIKNLNNKEKEIVTLKIISDLSYKDIAKLLNEPIGTIKWRYYKSINKIHLLLSNLTMSIITFIVGLKTIKKETIVINNQSENVAINNEYQDKTREEENKSINMNNLDYSNVVNETILPQEEIIIESIKPFGIAAITISITFLIAAIISFIKYQPKIKHKSSK